MKRALSLLLALCMLASIGSPAAWANDPSPSPEEETEAVLRLPSDTKTVGEEAFFGDTSLGEVVLPDEIESIGRNAFAESSLKKINLPNSLKSIDDTALPPPGTVIVTADEGSTAYNWAVENKYIAAPVAIDATNFPDATFRNYVAEHFDTNGNGSLSAEECAAVTEINVSWRLNIADLTGIAHFPALTELLCQGNRLTALDVSANTALLSLDCGFNQLTALDVSHNTALTELRCQGNRLTALDVSANTALTSLTCFGNQLTELNLSANTALTWLSCSDNDLTALDVSHNTALTELICSGNQLTELDVSHNTALTRLCCYDNGWLTELDISACPTLVAAMRGGPRTDYPGMMPGNVTVYGGTEYEYVLCVDESLQFIVPFVPVAVDATNFPDANFRAYVAESFDKDKDGKLSEEEIAAVTEIDVSWRDITDLTGVEHFAALTVLNCWNSRLMSLNVSANTALEVLLCDSNQLTSLDVSGCTALDWLDCGNNQLTVLGVTMNTALTDLDCEGNQLTALNVSTNTELRYLSCSGNQLKTLDVSTNTALVSFGCNSNELTALILGANTELTELHCKNNQLTSLDVSGCTALMRMYCSNNQLTTLNLTGCTALNYLSCAENALTSLALDDSSQLIALDCSQNALETLDVSANTALEQFRCEDNPLTTLDVSACPNLLVAVEQGEESVNEVQNLRVFDYDAALGYFRLSLPANADLILTPPSANVA